MLGHDDGPGPGQEGQEGAAGILQGDLHGIVVQRLYALHGVEVFLPGAGHPAADRRLGIDGARECHAHHLWRYNAADAGGRHCATHRGHQFRGRLVPAQDEWAAR